MTKIYGHRGSKGDYPENSMLAFKKAIESGVTGMEFDIHMAKDGELVVIHDATLDRTTNGVGFIKDFTIDDIKKFSIGEKYTEFGNYDVSWNDELVPALDEVLELCKNHDLEVNIELKTYEVSYPGIEEAALRAVGKSGYDPEKVVYSSFHLPTILRIKKIKPDAKIAWLVENFIPMVDDYMETFSLDAIHVDKKLVFGQPRYWQQFAKKLRVWTVNDEHEMKELIGLDVEAIITDYPQMAKNL